MRKPIIAGNWKMFKTLSEGQELAVSLRRELFKIEDVDIIICPPFTLLAHLADALESSNISLGAQDCFWEDEGAFTGEVSAKMIKDAGASFVIIGHSERRQYFGETNETVNKKIKAALKNGLIPILCIGETLKEREANQTFQVVGAQLQNSLKGLAEADVSGMTIAYEPVWAIGTGKTATAAQAEEVQKFIRDSLKNMYNSTVAANIRIQYGGSVKPENIGQLIVEPDIDGALVGGASLSQDSFVKIVFGASGVKK